MTDSTDMSASTKSIIHATRLAEEVIQKNDIDVTSEGSDLNCAEAKMCLADWRWAANKGFWDCARQCWNESVGGMSAYLIQRSMRRAEIFERQSRRLERIRQKLLSAKQRTETGAQCEQEFYHATKSDQAAFLHGSVGVDWFPPLTIDAEFGAWPLLEFMYRNGWGHLAVRHFWSAGYTLESVFHIFNDIPPSLRDALSEAIDAAQMAASCSAKHADLDHSSNEFMSESFHDREQCSEGWEEDSTLSFIELCYDPETQVRIKANANTRTASLLGMDRAELLARMEQYDVLVPLSPLDAVAMFLHALGVTRDTMSTCYFRLTPSASLRSRKNRVLLPPAQLLCSTTIRSFDALGRLKKVNIATRVITPDEYDAAARLHPALCPLVVVGDTRCGRRLLSNADNDARIGFASSSMAMEGEGCGESGHSGMMQRYLDAAHTVALRLRRLTKYPAAAAASAMPARRRKRPDPEEGAADKSQEEMVGASATSRGSGADQGKPQHDSQTLRRRCRRRRIVPLERPEMLVGGETLLHVDLDDDNWESRPFPLFSCRRRWAEPILCRFWTHGFQTQVLASILDNVPQRLEVAIENLLSTIHASSSAITQAKHSTPNLPLVDQDEANIWELEGNISFLRMDYDPVTQRRQRVLMNRKMAALHGVRSDEVLARFASHEAILPLCEADALRIFVYDLMSSQQSLQRFFFRVAWPKGLCCLVCRNVHRIFDAAGRLVTLKHTTEVVSPEEYDEAVRRDPMVSVLAATGDLRTGQQLLDDASQDRLRSVAWMAATQSGRVELEEMAVATEFLTKHLLPEGVGRSNLSEWQRLCF